MKIICDVCGTTFPETATHCPICGCAKAPAAQATADRSNGDDSGSYAKGGRFAKSNVRRDTRSRASSGRFSSERNRQSEPQESNKGLIAVVIILLLAIVMVVVYIGFKVFITQGDDTGNDNPQQTTAAQQDGQTSKPDGQTIACTSIKLSHKILELNTEGQSFALAVTKEPQNTTDVVTYTSADPAIATVDTKGNVVPVGYGETTITVKCGSATAECKVISTVGTPPTTTPPPVTGPTVPDGFVLKLNRDDFTLSKEGEKWNLLKGIELSGLSASDITWSSSDPAVATVENGMVVGVDRGNCIITAQIGGQIVTCKVFCSFDAAPPATYKISKTDVTISQGESFNLSLQDKETGANIQGIEWKASVEGVVEISGNKITGGTVSKLTRVDVYVEYEGETYTCVVYVKAP